MATNNNVVPSRTVLEVVGDKSYENWCACLKSYLLSQELWDFVSEPKSESRTVANQGSENEDETATTSVTATTATASPDWRRRNAAALHAIQISCGSEILYEIRDITSAKEAWDTLEEMHRDKVPADDVVEQPAGAAPGTDQCQPDAGMSRHGDKNPQHRQLHDLVVNGDIEGIRECIRSNPEAIRYRLAARRGTALHLAANLGKSDVVEELLGHMQSAGDLEIQDAGGSTALHIAAASGHQKMAELMVQRNPDLLGIVNRRQMTPLREACGKNHKQLATFLYYHTSVYSLSQINEGKHCSNIIKCCILAQMFDIALDLLRIYPRMATIMDGSNSNAATQLSLMPGAFPSGTVLPFWQSWIYSLIQVSPDYSLDNLPEERGRKRSSDAENGQHLSLTIAHHTQVCGSDHDWCNKLVSVITKVTGTRNLYDLKRVHICSLKILSIICENVKSIPSDSRTTLRDHGVLEAFRKAIENGIVEFVQNAVKACPALLHKFDKKGRSLFMTAVEYRQEKIFNLLYPLSDKPAIVSYVDNDKNTMLHMAGMLSPSSKLSGISGAALQMQRELQWFKEVERVVNPMYKENTNNDGETARQIFTRTHKDLAANGEKWMKETATSSTVVGALIITIMFTAAFTVPGGNNQDTGIPVLLKDKWFRVFIISDSISLFAASTSVLMFLGILTSRYSEQDFLRSLPAKLVIGLSTLFISIATMMATFCATLMMVMDRQWQFVIPITLLASVPVTLFMLLQFPVLVEIFLSTYGSGIFQRKYQPWL